MSSKSLKRRSTSECLFGGGTEREREREREISLIMADVLFSVLFCLTDTNRVIH